MADDYITAEPTTLDEFVDAAKDQGFAYDPKNHSIIHADGRGCWGISEEEHGGDTYVGCTNDPQLDGIEVYEQGSDGYREINGVIQIRVRCFDIVWDADDGDDLSDLPSEHVIECDDDDLDDEGFLADALSDEFGWCVEDLDYEVIEAGEGEGDDQ